MTQKIGLIIFPGFQALDLAVGTAFELANEVLGEPRYEIEILSEHGGVVEKLFRRRRRQPTVRGARNSTPPSCAAASGCSMGRRGSSIF